MVDDLIGPDDISAAADRLRGRVLRTPLVALAASGVLMKAENLQSSGSFKIRGALNSLLQLEEDEARRGVVAHSSGNHAIAVAMAGAALGIPVTVVMPEDAPATKIRRTRAAGATVELVAPDSESRQRRAHELAEQAALSLVEPYDSDAVLAATATIAVEILEDLPDEEDAPATIYVAVSGGGLAGGVAAGAKLRGCATRVIGVEPEVAADALASWTAGRRVALPAARMASTMADGLRVQQVGVRPWAHLEQYLDDIITVSEDQISDAMRSIASDACMVAEASGAVSVAGALSHGGPSAQGGRRPVAVLSGGNVDASVFASVLTHSSV